MKNRFIQIGNLLSMVETKGESTLIMAECMRFVSDSIRACDEAEKQTAPEDDTPAE